MNVNVLEDLEGTAADEDDNGAVFTMKMRVWRMLNIEFHQLLLFKSDGDPFSVDDDILKFLFIRMKMML